MQAHRAGSGTDGPAVWGLTVVGYAVAVAAFGLLFREPAAQRPTALPLDKVMNPDHRNEGACGSA